MHLLVNPNRMELLRLRKRLALARRGHKLLQDKLEEMVRRFLTLYKQLQQATIDLQQRTTALQADLLYLRLTSPVADLVDALDQIDARIDLRVTTRRIMNVRVPDLELIGCRIERGYGYFSTSGQLDLVTAGAAEYTAALLRLAQLYKTLDILSLEIERTRRRVNALRYLMIPSIEETIRFINQKLNELERGNLVRLMRVKEIVRRH